LIAQPLTDLACNLEIPKQKGRAAYTRAMKGFTLEGLWKQEHDHAFLRLKVTLTSKPVLKGPKYDGTTFIMTTDGCKYRFAGMLTQKFTTILPNGTERTMAHPIGFASK
jgi:RNase H-like domain found in reverse transcriptase